MTTSPGRGELPRILRRLLTSSGMKKAELARVTGFSEAKVSRTLGGQSVPTADAVTALVTAMGQQDTDDGQRAIALAAAVKEGTASRIVLLRDGAQRLQQRFGSLEAKSAHIQTYSPVVVPGLLQIARYAQAVFSSTGLPADEVAGGVRNRLKRQQRLQDPAYRFTQITTEGALRWQALDRDLMAEQLEHLAHFARTVDPDRVLIGIVPWTVAVDMFPIAGFDIYDQRELILGTDLGSATIKAPGDVAVYLRMFSRLTQAAVFGEAAAVEFDRIAHEYSRLDTPPAG